MIDVDEMAVDINHSVQAMEGWRRLSLHDLVDRLEAGVSTNSEDRPALEGEKGVLKTSAVTNGMFNPNEHKAIVVGEYDRACTSVLGDSIIISRMNTLKLVGASAYVERDYPQIFLPDRLWQLRVKNDISARWLSYVLSSEDVRRNIADTATGTSASMKNIAKPSLLGLQLLVPPLVEQQAIAQILSTWDTAIETTAKLIAAKELQKRGLMQDLISRTHGEKRKMGSLLSLKQIKNRGSVVTNVITVGKYAIRRQEDHFNRIVASKNVSNYWIIEPGDFVYDPMSAYYGAIGRYDLMEKGIVSPVYKVMALQPGVSSDFMKHLLKSHYMQFQLAVSSTQGNKEGKRRGLQHSAFAGIEVMMPKFSEQEKIASILSTCDTELDLLRKKLDALRRQKKGLMAELLTGRRRVATEAMVE